MGLTRLKQVRLLRPKKFRQNLWLKEHNQLPESPICFLKVTGALIISQKVFVAPSTLTVKCSLYVAVGRKFPNAARFEMAAVWLATLMGILPFKIDSGMTTAVKGVLLFRLARLELNGISLTVNIDSELIEETRLRSTVSVIGFRKLAEIIGDVFPLDYSWDICKNSDQRSAD